MYDKILGSGHDVAAGGAPSRQGCWTCKFRLRVHGSVGHDPLRFSVRHRYRWNQRIKVWGVGGSHMYGGVPRGARVAWQFGEAKGPNRHCPRNANGRPRAHVFCDMPRVRPARAVLGERGRGVGEAWGKCGEWHDAVDTMPPGPSATPAAPRACHLPSTHQ